jgi:hypothetical protein
MTDQKKQIVFYQRTDAATGLSTYKIIRLTNVTKWDIGQSFSKEEFDDVFAKLQDVEIVIK